MHYDKEIWDFSQLSTKPFLTVATCLWKTSSMTVQICIMSCFQSLIHEEKLKILMLLAAISSRMMFLKKKSTERYKSLLAKTTDQLIFLSKSLSEYKTAQGGTCTYFFPLLWLPTWVMKCRCGCYVPVGREPEQRCLYMCRCWQDSLHSCCQKIFLLPQSYKYLCYSRACRYFTSSFGDVHFLIN